MISPEKILAQYWGFSQFRTPQKEIITAVLEEKDVITLLPTGGGKSLCFQIPGLVKEGTCLVISPLIALMQDQVENLKKLHIKAVTIPSGTSPDEIITLFDTIKFGNVKFLYISPERLQSPLIQQKLTEVNLNLVAIDEAHCISEWGYDFRPSYRNIKILKNLNARVPFIALTATANKRVLKDIEENLELKSPKIFRKSFSRKNLAYQVFKIEDKLQRLLQIFTKTKTPAIVYVNSRKKTEEIANFLNANGFRSGFYHAGLSKINKQISFDNWMTEKTPIMVATNAFGMGIDKPNVGLVIHYNLPFSLENYVQETGRAGRNNKKSFAALFYNEHDILMFKEQLQKSLPTILEIKEIHKKLYQYFRIANGEIAETSFDFNILEFSKKYNFSVLKTDAVLKIISNYGIIEITDNYNKKSTLKFITHHSAILKFGEKNKSLSNFISVLLRTYGGLFDNEIKIDEFFIAKKAGITSKKVIENLEILQELEFLEYIPVQAAASLLFLVPREDDKTINRFAKNIQQFLYQKNKKAADLLRFIKNDALCRSIQLLSYFDEHTAEKCGICDVCLLERKSIKENLSEKIIALLKVEKMLTSKEISDSLHSNEKDILIHLRNLLALDKIFLNHQNKFQNK
ncbi:RecQ family ATP-dependent DNA helicase [Polaribacter batillariae]|uniref:ATP-dependent DNA helicase RecQ n=1 Tax=Polaribacter batillariae TaxID=2808900 RepID=A0ABX7SVW9_9FLAO|nr:ATP-dependent DNA helicase RecQ [Polaribacter batillariae]QTD38387.1 RecQ family ATP-dependent DNA helicase [Polaribacter batillariae]